MKKIFIVKVLIVYSFLTAHLLFFAAFAQAEFPGSRVSASSDLLQAAIPRCTVSGPEGGSLSLGTKRTAGSVSSRKDEAVGLLTRAGEVPVVMVSISIARDSIEKAFGIPSGYESIWISKLNWRVDGARLLPIIPRSDMVRFTLPVSDGENTFSVRLSVPAMTIGGKKVVAGETSRTFAFRVVHYILTPLGRVEKFGKEGPEMLVGTYSRVLADSLGNVFFIGGRDLGGGKYHCTLRRFSPDGPPVIYELAEGGDSQVGNNIAGEIDVLGLDPKGRLYARIFTSLVVFRPDGRYLETLGTLYAGFERPWQPVTNRKNVQRSIPKTALLPRELATRTRKDKWGNFFLSAVYDPKEQAFIALTANIDSNRYKTPSRPEVREPGYFLVRIGLDGSMQNLLTLEEPLRGPSVEVQRAPIFRDEQGRVSIMTKREILRFRDGKVTREPRPWFEYTTYLAEGFAEDGGTFGSGSYSPADNSWWCLNPRNRRQTLWLETETEPQRFRDLVTGKEVPGSPLLPDGNLHYTSSGRLAGLWVDGWVAVVSRAGSAPVRQENQK
jgi:hypothetical protein